MVFLHDPVELGQLSQHLGEIQRATRELDLGGAFFPNRLHLEQALHTLEAWRDGRCRCTLYPGYLFCDPHREQAAEQVEIVSSAPPDWFMTYRCRCPRCLREYEVEQGESHHTWWQWRPA